MFLFLVVESLLKFFLYSSRRLDLLYVGKRSNGWPFELLCRQKLLDCKIGKLERPPTKFNSMAQSKQPNFRYSFQNIILPFVWRRLCIWYLGDYMQWGTIYKGNHLLVKRLNVETKQKWYVPWAIGNRLLSVVSVVWRSRLWLVTIQ